MSKKKKKKEPHASASASAGAAAEHDEQDESSETEAASSDHENAADAHASEAHGDGGHGHGGHDPVEQDRPKNGLIAFITLLTCITLIAFCVFVRELFNAWGHEELQRKVLSVQSEQLKELRASEKQKLSKYQWVSQKDGVVRIPTDRAIDLTIAAYRNPPPVEPPKLQEPTPTPNPEGTKPEEKKGDEGKDKKDDKGAKDEKKPGDHK
jgi:hypothetical protein